MKTNKTNTKTELTDVVNGIWCRAAISMPAVATLSGCAENSDTNYFAWCLGGLAVLGLGGVIAGGLASERSYSRIYSGSNSPGYASHDPKKKSRESGSNSSGCGGGYTPITSCGGGYSGGSHSNSGSSGHSDGGGHSGCGGGSSGCGGGGGGGCGGGGCGGGCGGS